MVQPIASYNLADEWITILLLLVVIVFGWINVNYGKRIPRLFSAILSTRLLRQFMREEMVFSQSASLGLTGCFLCVFSLLLYEADVLFGFDLFMADGILLWACYLLVSVLIIFSKNLSVFLVKGLIGGDFGLSEYRYTSILAFKASGLVLLPFAVLGAFLSLSAARYAVIIGGSIHVIVLIIRLLRGFSGAFGNRAPLFYIFLYLCTLEILPLVLVFRLIALKIGD
jgi:hypothetical protein